MTRQKNILKKAVVTCGIALMCSATAFAQVEINETNFPDENFRNWILAQNYGDGNVFLTETEIADITFMDVNDQNISNLSGIGFFTALRYLYCEANQLTSLDVSGLINLVELSWGLQFPTLTLTNTGDNYSIEIALNNPNTAVFTDGVIYKDGKLISTSNEIKNTYFQVDVTGIGIGNTMWGMFTLKYEEVTNVSEIKNETRQALGFYNVMGVKLDKEPQKGVYIVVYNNGESEKRVKKQ